MCKVFTWKNSAILKCDPSRPYPEKIYQAFKLGWNLEYQQLDGC